MPCPEFPDDADGDALRRIAEAGADMSRPMRVEFQVDASSRCDAEAIERLATARGYDAHTFEDDDGSLCVILAVLMVANYEGVVSRQAEITDFVRSFGTHCDSWGTWGN